MIRIFVSLVVTLALGSALGCGGKTPPERSYYLLRGAPQEFSTADGRLGVGLGIVQVAPYLDRAGVMVEVDANEVREARFHLWAEPLQRGIRYYLEDRIAADLGRQLAPGPPVKNGWLYRVDVRVREFHGDLDGHVRLVASFTLVGVESGEILLEEQVSFAGPRRIDGYPGLVQAQISLLDRLATSIADAIRGANIPTG
jgi:uncharacterized lipoprotein YmbA